MNRRLMIARVLLILSAISYLLILAGDGYAEDVTLGVSDDSSKVTITNAAIPGAAIHSPEEGLWSIGTGWNSNGPAKWHHGSPAKSTKRGEWTVLSGIISTGDGQWTVSDQYRVDASGLVHAKRRWQYDGSKPSGPIVLSIRYATDRTEGKPLRPFLPGIQYYGNPSGTRIDASRIPTWAGNIGDEALYEEHRYPLPFAAAEQDGQFIAALHSRPSKLPHAARNDLWWSLGLIETEAGTELTLQSGPLASNGQRGVAKALQKAFLPYEHAHLVGIPPGTVIEKDFWIQLAPATEVGHGFRSPLWTSIDLFDPRLTSPCRAPSTFSRQNCVILLIAGARMIPHEAFGLDRRKLNLGS